MRHAASLLFEHVAQSDAAFDEAPLSEAKMRLVRTRNQNGGVRWLVALGYQELGVGAVMDLMRSPRDDNDSAPHARASPALPPGEYSSVEYLVDAHSTLVTITDLAQVRWVELT